jgi:diacylglycerol kinase (ATP)
MQEGTLQESAATKRSPGSAILIANPTSGSYIYHVQQLRDTVTFLRAHGWQADLKLTQVAGDARRLAQDAVDRCVDMVVVAGGDGTINEVIQALAGSQAALGVLPSGTVNVWAREVGIPLDIAGAREVLIRGQVRSIDLGRVNERSFLLMAGIGLDGEITHAVERRPVKRLGLIAYLFVGAWLGLGYPAFRALLQVDGRIIRANALQIIVGNTQLYAGAIKYTWQAKADDGLLDVCIVYKRSMFGRIIVILDFLRRKHRQRWIRYERCTELKVLTRRAVGIQVDGDPAAYTTQGRPPTIFTIAPTALKVIVPCKPPEGLFSESA